jgi:ribosomal-protein-alanine N-acetyltransferase
MPDLGAFAATHAAAFAGGVARPWRAEEFADLLASPLVFLVGDARVFAMGRAVAGEVELLTLATHPDDQGKGLGKAILADFHAEAVRRGCERAFIEVAETNSAARGLYLASGYAQDGHRPAYYRSTDGVPVAALLLSRTLP